MARSLVEGIIEVLNDIPSATRITSTISPATIVEGKSKMNIMRKIIVIGLYDLVYTGISNIIKPRAVPDITLRMPNNTESHNFMSLHTRRRIYRYKWEELPLDEYIIEIIETLADIE